jgi:quinol monooxygenase YgiN
MLLLTAFIEVAPTDRGAIDAALPEVVAASQRDEGCEEYGCYEYTQQRGRYVFVERWRDRAALDGHLRTPHMAAWMKVAGPKMTSARGFIHEIATTAELKP